MFLRVMQWTSHCVSWQIDFVGVLFGLWPRFLLFLFVLFALFFRWRNASLAGGFAGRRVGWFLWLCVVCCFNRFACPIGHDMSLYKYLFCLCSCKDRAFSATSATLEEKK